eukprot:763905-Hanusia_phi.AAC.1
MSRITTFNPDEITIKSFQVDYMTINSFPGAVVNEMDNERLLVNQFETDRFSIIGGKHGLAINATRQQASEMTGVGLFVDDNIYLTGTLYASNIHILGNNINDSNVEKIISAINDYTLPIQSSGLIDSILYNYYMPDFLTIGTLNDSINNRNALNITRRANNSISNIQLAIRNQTDNVQTQEISEFLIGTVGDSGEAPAILMTSIGKSLEFHISRNRHDIDIAYNNNLDYYSNVPNYSNIPIPAAVIDTQGCLNINDTNALDIAYNIDFDVTLSNTTRLNVNGLAYMHDIITYDYFSQDIKHLNDIYVRKEGFTLYTHQLYPGEFAAGPFLFTCNVTIPTLEVTHDLIVHSNVLFAADFTIQDTSSNSFHVMTDSFFNKQTYIDDATCYNLDISGSLQKNGSNLNVTDINIRSINTDIDSILSFIPDYISNSNDLAISISTYIHMHDISNLQTYLQDAENLDQTLANEITLRLLTNSYIDKTHVLSYALNTAINFDSSNLIVPGLVGIGIQNTEPYNNMLTINRHANLDQYSPEILINDIQDLSIKYIHKAYIGHSRGVNLNGNDYNTFSITTNPNKSGNHHIAFFPGVVPTLSEGVQSFTPSLILYDQSSGTRKVGFNITNPRNDIDLNQNVLFGNDVYKMYKDQQLKIVHMLLNYNNKVILDHSDVSIIDLNISNLTITNGIIHTSGYMLTETDGSLTTLQSFREKTDGMYIDSGNINIGYQADITPIHNVALQIRNHNTEGNNNTVVRLFQAYDSWNNTDQYTGFDICRYTNNTDNKWYIYNRNDGTQNLHIGYQQTSELDFSFLKMLKLNDINEIYINNNTNDRTYINGSLTVYGDIAIEGSNNTYKLNGLELTSNSINISAIEPPASNDLSIQKEYDILIQANKVVNLVRDTSSFYVGHMVENDGLINYLALYLNEQNSLSTTLQDGVDSRFVVFHRQIPNDVNHTPAAAFKVYPQVNDITGDCRVRLGILPTSAQSKYYRENSYADLQLLSSLNNYDRVSEFRLNLYSTTLNDTTTFRIYNNNGFVYYKFADATVPHIATSLFHVYGNNHQHSLHLQNDNLSVSLLLQNNTNNWNLTANSDFAISSNLINKIILQNNNVGINVDKPSYTLDIFNNNSGNLGCSHLVNNYTTITNLVVESNINFPVSLMSYDPDVIYSSNADNPLRFVSIGSKQITIPFSTSIYDLTIEYYQDTTNQYDIDIEIEGTYKIDFFANVQLIKGMALPELSLIDMGDDVFTLSYLNDFGYSSNIDYISKVFYVNQSFDFNSIQIDINRDVIIEYQRYANNDGYGIINVSYNQAKPHIVMESYLANTFNSQFHHLYSYNGLFEIYAEQKNDYYRKILGIDDTGNLTVNSIDVNELKIAGNSVKDFTDILNEFKNLQINTIESSNNIYIKSDRVVLMNTDIVEFDLDDNFVVDRNKQGSNILTVSNYYDVDSYLFFTNNIQQYYKIGISGDHFKLFYKEIPIPALDIEYDPNNQNFYYRFYGKIDYETLNKGEIDIGDLHITKNSIYNSNPVTTDIISFYKNTQMIMNLDSRKITVNNKLLANAGIDVIGGINQLSDKRLKENIKKIDSALEKIDSLNGVIYHNVKSNKTETGLIAQDVVNVLPEVISYDSDNYLNISYGNMMGFIVEAIKELKNEFNNLKYRVEKELWKP